MFKVYKKADILEKISDRVKMVDDLYHLPPDLFDRELFDYWYSVYLDDYQDRGYDDFDFDLRDIRLFYYAFYLMECRGCCNLVLIEFGDMIYFIFDPSGFATLESKFRNEREELLRKVSDLTNLLPVLEREGNNGLHAGTWVNVPCTSSTAITPITYKHARNGAERR